MRSIENYEMVVSGEDSDRLLLTFDWADAPHLPKSVSSVSFDVDAQNFRVVFEDAAHWEEIVFPQVPKSLHELIKQFASIVVVGLSDEVEMFAESPLEIRPTQND